MTFEKRRAAALVRLSKVIADAHQLHDILSRVHNVRGSDGWCGWVRGIETASDSLGAAIAEVTRNAELA